MVTIRIGKQLQDRVEFTWQARLILGEEMVRFETKTAFCARTLESSRNPAQKIGSLGDNSLDRTRQSK